MEPPGSATSSSRAGTRRPRSRSCSGPSPTGSRPIVVDNGSTDGTADVARTLGATVVHEARPGYGAAVHAGSWPRRPSTSRSWTATTRWISATCRRCSTRCATRASRWPSADAARSRSRRLAVARAGRHELLATWLRRSQRTSACTTSPPCGSAAATTCWPSTSEDRRFGYPLELMVKAAPGRLDRREIDIAYRPRAAGTRSKVSGSMRGTAQAVHDFAGGAPMSGPTILVVAKAPVPGLAKTRIAADLGDAAAADLAAAALLDTLETAVSSGLPRRRRHDRRPRPGRRGARDPRPLMAGLVVVPQGGDGFGERLAHAHRDADAVTASCRSAWTRRSCVPTTSGGRPDRLSNHPSVLGPAEDGGWWLLGVRHGVGRVRARTVAMSTATATGQQTSEVFAGTHRPPPLTARHRLVGRRDARGEDIPIPSSRSAAAVSERVRA